MPTLIVSAIGLTGVAASIATALIGFAISYVANSLFAPDEPNAPEDQGVQARIPTNPRNKLPVIYGSARVAGQIIFADISSDNQTMYFVIALCEGPIESITSVTWQDQVLTFDGDISATLSSVTNAVNRDGEESDFLNGNLKCRVHLNEFNDITDLTEEKSPRWFNNSVNRRLPNTACAYLELSYDRENSVVSLPSRLYFQVNGRTVNTLDTVTNTLTTTEPSTMTSNPVDNLIDYLTNTRYGCGLTENSLDLPSFSVHKEFCNDEVAFQQNSCVFPANSFTTSTGETAINPLDYDNEVACDLVTYFVTTGGTTTSATSGVWTLGAEEGANRYTTNGVVNTNAELDRNISDLTVGNGGIMTYSLGKFGLISEGVRAVAQRDGANVSFSEDNIIGSLEITGSGFDAVLNEVTMKFTSPRQDFQQEQVIITFPEVNTVQNPNEPRLEKTLQLPLTNNSVEATRAGTIIVNDSRQALIVQFQSDIENSDLQAGDVIQISHETPNWVNKEFRVQQIDEKVSDNTIGVSIIAREYAASVYTSATLLLNDPTPNTRYPNPLVVSPLNTVAKDEDALGTGNSASMVINGVPTSQILVSWDNSTFLDTVDIRYIQGNIDAAAIAALTDNQWTNISADGEQVSVFLTNLEPEGTYQIQARARNTLGATGSFGPIGDTNKIEITTVSLESIAPLTIEIVSDNGGTIYKNNTGTKALTATASVIGVALTDVQHDALSYRWTQDGQTICLSGNSNDVVGTATRIIQALPRDPNSEDTIDQLACVSAGGTWATDAGSGAQVQCQNSGGGVFDVQSDSIRGCTVSGANRADTDNTGSTLSVLRTIDMGAEDFEDSAGISCVVSNIT